MKGNRENLLASLKDFGLSDKESLVYLTALEAGPSPILRLSRLSGLKRPTVYVVVESLMKKGLMNIEVTGFKKGYVAEKPGRLEALFEEKRRELIKSLPFLEQIAAGDKNSAFIKYYEGLEAVKLVYKELLKEVQPNEDYLVIGNQEQWYSLDAKFFQKFIEDRAKLKIKIRVLLQDSEMAREHKKFERNYNEQIRILPPESVLSTNMVILPGKVVIQQLHAPVFAIVIENESVARMNRELFEIIWKALA